MNHMTDTMRVEMSLPVHIMLAVLLSGANCAEPPTVPEDKSQAGIQKWKNDWDHFNKRMETDQVFRSSYEIFNKTKALLLEASAEAVKDVYPPRKQASLLRRIERLHHESIDTFLKVDKPDPRKIGIVAFYLLQHLVDTETLIVPEESSLGKALDYMLPALSPREGSSEQEIEDYENLNRSARKQVRKMIYNLQNQGYYRGIPLPDF